MTAGRLLEEVAARVAERSSGSPHVASGQRQSRTGAADGRGTRELAEEEAALGDAWLAHHGLEPLPGDDARAFLRFHAPLEDAGVTVAPYSPGASEEEEALWRAHAANLGLAEDKRP